MAKHTMERIINDDLKLKVYKKVKAQLFSEATKEKKKKRIKILVKIALDDMHGPILWHDEKVITIQAVQNHQNDRILCKNIKTIPVE